MRLASAGFGESHDGRDAPAIDEMVERVCSLLVGQQPAWPTVRLDVRVHGSLVMVTATGDVPC